MNRKRLAPLWLAAWTWMSGCASPGGYAKLEAEVEALQIDNRRLMRDLTRKDQRIAGLQSQVSTLQEFGPDRPLHLFAPVKIEIASLSRGTDFDGQPGDDGVTVHVQPKDEQGDAVKAPGMFRIQLLDNGSLSEPRVVGVYTFEDPLVLRRAWLGRFGANHYTFRCPFPEGSALNGARSLLVTVQFVSFVTGETLSASKEVPVSLPN